MYKNSNVNYLFYVQSKLFFIISISSLPIMNLNLFWSFRLEYSGYIPFHLVFWKSFSSRYLIAYCIYYVWCHKAEWNQNKWQTVVCKSLRFFEIWWEKAEFKFGFFTWVKKSLLASALLLMPDIWLHMTEVESVCYPLRSFYFVDDWDGPLIFAHAMTSFSDEIDRLPTTFLLLNNKINWEPVCLSKLTSVRSFHWFRIFLFKKLLCCF